MAFPDIQNPSSVEEEHHKAKIRSDFSAGYVHQRAKWTRSRKKFMLSWKYLPEADLSTLLTHFDNNQGATFSWTHPTRGDSYTVFYSDDKINYVVVPGTAGKWYKVNFGIEEQ